MADRAHRPRAKSDSGTGRGPNSRSNLRIIGGQFHGRRLAYLARNATRPMKHRVREAIFNLVGRECSGRHAIDLFAGTGAVGLEAISRGAASVTFIEQHIPTARVLRENIGRLDLEDRCELRVTSAFLWAKRDLPELQDRPHAKFQQPVASQPVASQASRQASAQIRPHSKQPWIVFMCPPYAFYRDKKPDLLALMKAILHVAPAGSTLVVEADARFNFEEAPKVWRSPEAASIQPATWDIRTYPPAVVGLLRDPARSQFDGR